MKTVLKKYTKKTVSKVAEEFAYVLQDWLTKDEMCVAIHRNRWEKDKQVCHSHDFCDANMAMNEALKKVIKHRETDELDDPKIDLWNKAWALAKKNEFYVFNVQPMSC